MIEMLYSLADQEFYAPLESCARRGAEFRPSAVPADWSSRAFGIWTVWQHGGARPAAQGWKVHVSAEPDRLAHVLDVVAAVCFELDVPFKHLTADLFYLVTHHKHGNRKQSGKFCVAYPSDEDGARALLERLRDELAGEQGPFVLSDRRYRDSTTVHYRYGGFTKQQVLAADGTTLALITDGTGARVTDRREVEFVLPPGITDPFLASAAEENEDDDDPTIGGFLVTAALAHSNAGGAYRATHAESGREVFLKEARGHTGLSWDRRCAVTRLRDEWETLRALHAAEPGIAPEPLAHFRAWEHEFLATEFVPGRTLKSWMVRHNVFARVDAGTADWAEYHGRCERIIAELHDVLDRLHAAGYVFGDLSPANILVDEHDHVRLIDFEAARKIGTAPAGIGTGGFTPPAGVVDVRGTAVDDYGLSALAQFLLNPLHHVAQRNPDALTHLHYDLAERAPVPQGLWERAVRFHTPAGTSPLPGPEQVAAEPLRHLTALRTQIADGILAMADPAHPLRVFPTVPQGYEGNTTCVAYGTAGVLHALRQAGVPVDAPILERFRRDATSPDMRFAPGLHVGSAGIAWVLAEYGMLDEARDVLAGALAHPLTRSCATFAHGSAGVLLASLALYGHTGDERHLDDACALAGALPPDHALTPLLGPHDATGLLHGRTGIALALQQLSAVTDDRELLGRAVRLLHAELDRASEPDGAVLSFPVSTVDTRSMPYLYCGTAGVLRVLSRCLRTVDDERLADALPRLVRKAHMTYTVLPGLYQGLTGLGFALSEHGELADDVDATAGALRCARALFKYAIPHGTGVRFLGDLQLRFSADLWSGSSGLLLFLSRVLDPRQDMLFTVDALARDRAKPLHRNELLPVAG